MILLLLLLPLTLASLAIPVLLWRRQLRLAALVFAITLIILSYPADQIQRDLNWARNIHQQLPADALILEEAQLPVPQRPWLELMNSVTRIQTAHDSHPAPVHADQYSILLQLSLYEFHNGQTAIRQTALLNCTTQDLVIQQADGLRIDMLPVNHPLLHSLCPPDTQATATE